jgi:hypothetical protein
MDGYVEVFKFSTQPFSAPGQPDSDQRSVARKLFRVSVISYHLIHTAPENVPRVSTFIFTLAPQASYPMTMTTQHQYHVTWTTGRSKACPG